MTNHHQVYNKDFPGVFAAMCVMGVFSLIWPWVVLSGVTKIVVGVLWSLYVLLIGIAVISRLRYVKRPQTLPSAHPEPAAALMPLLPSPHDTFGVGVVPASGITVTHS